MPGSDFSARERAVQTGFKNEITPDAIGKQRTQATIADLQGQVDNIVDGLTAQGNLTPAESFTKKALENLRGKAFYSSEREGAIQAINKVGKEVVEKSAKKQPLYEFTPRDLQNLKQQFYDEINWERTNQIVQANGQFSEGARKAIAHQAMVTLEKMNPEIGALNKKTGAYIDLQKAIEYSISRYDNLNVGGLQAMILALKNIGLAATEIFLGTPSAKAKIAFALGKANQLKWRAINVPAAAALRSSPPQSSGNEMQDALNRGRAAINNL
jgi:hypothetical protein